MDTSWMKSPITMAAIGVLVGMILSSKLKIGEKLSNVPVIGGLFA